MTSDAVSNSAASREIQRDVLVLKKQQDVARDVAQSLVELVKDAPTPAPGRSPDFRFYVTAETAETLHCETRV